MKKAKSEKIIKYRDVITSKGQSGSPIILKYKNG
jgi:hypothetical protein